MQRPVLHPRESTWTKALVHSPHQLGLVQGQEDTLSIPFSISSHIAPSPFFLCLLHFVSLSIQILGKIYLTLLKAIKQYMVLYLTDLYPPVTINAPQSYFSPQ